MRSRWAILDTRNPLVAWETAIGRIASSRYGGHDTLGVSLRLYNLLRQCEKGDSQRQQIVRQEVRLENVRRAHFAEKVSRLEGVFLFEDADTASRALDRWDWNDRSPFLSELGFKHEKVTRVDSEWITRFLGDPSADPGWMHRYWSGEMTSEPIPELISTGIGTIWSSELRQRSFDGFLELMPLASPVLSGGVMAFWCGAMSAAQVVARIRADQGRNLHGDLLIYMGDFHADSDFSMSDCISRFREQGHPPMGVHPAAVNASVLQTPDFSSYSFQLTDGDELGLSPLIDLANRARH